MRLFMLLVGTVAIGVANIPGEEQKADTYAGTETCIKCHRIRDKALTEGVKASPLFHALQPADAEGAIEADFTDAPISKDNVQWVICSKRPEQNYVDKNLQLLPATWSNEMKRWVARESVDAVTNCLGCHTVGLDVANRTWVSAGVGCESCHGPQRAHAKNPGRVKPSLKLGSLSVSKVSMICGQCHSAGQGKQGLPWPDNFRPGMELSDVFEFAPESEFTGRNQIYNEWLSSPHGDKVACITCHDQHNLLGAAKLLKKPTNELCGSCHKEQANLADHAPDAAPTDTCATCHMPGSSHTFR